MLDKTVNWLLDSVKVCRDVMPTNVLSAIVVIEFVSNVMAVTLASEFVEDNTLNDCKLFLLKNTVWSNGNPDKEFEPIVVTTFS